MKHHRVQICAECSWGDGFRFGRAAAVLWTGTVPAARPLAQPLVRVENHRASEPFSGGVLTPQWQRGQQRGRPPAAFFAFADLPFQLP